MAEFEIIGAPDAGYANWYLDASAKHGVLEFRLATPWGAKLAEISNYKLAQETTLDEKEYIFNGTLGRFAVIGMVHSVDQTGSLNVAISEEDEPELLALLGEDKFITPTEWILGIE